MPCSRSPGGVTQHALQAHTQQEVEGDLARGGLQAHTHGALQVHTRRGLSQHALRPTPPATAAGDTHLTGMNSCYECRNPNGELM